MYPNVNTNLRAKFPKNEVWKITPKTEEEVKLIFLILLLREK